MIKKSIVAIAVVAALSGACNKSPNIATDSPQVQAEPFQGQVYRSFDGRTTLTLISADECELNSGGTTLLCKYTKQSGALRVVTTAMGTNQVIYYRFVDQGLQGNDGVVLFSPQGLAKENQRRQEIEEKHRKIMADAPRLILGKWSETDNLARMTVTADYRPDGTWYFDGSAEPFGHWKIQGDMLYRGQSGVGTMSYRVDDMDADNYTLENGRYHAIRIGPATSPTESQGANVPPTANTPIMESAPPTFMTDKAEIFARGKLSDQKTASSYSSLRSRLTASGKARLKQEQLNWLKFRAAQTGDGGAQRHSAIDRSAPRTIVAELA